MFRQPPGVELCAAEGFSRIEVFVPEDHWPGSDEFREDLRQFGLTLGLVTSRTVFAVYGFLIGWLSISASSPYRVSGWGWRMDDT